MKIATPDTDYANQKDKISIHAIVKIATTYSVNEFGVYTISIHAIVKIATPPLLPRLYDKPHFNPRYREDSDHIKRFAHLSLHYFNPRYREDSDV